MGELIVTLLAAPFALAGLVAVYAVALAVISWALTNDGGGR